MNLVEFIFAVTAVFGSTAIIMAWTSFTYRIEQRHRESNQETLRIIEQQAGE